MPGLSRSARILLSLAVALLLVAAPACCAGQPRYLGLTILHTNDIHGHLFPFDYDALGKQESQVGGAARRAALIRQLKGSSANPVLVMDAGDVFTRGPLSDLKGVVDFEVMNAVGYDIMALGNNELKGAPGLEGRKIMFDRIRQARFPVVSANVFDQATGKTIVPEYEIFELGELKVGVFGLTAQRVAAYDQARGLDVRDPVAAARRVVAELEGRCNLIVALTHVGYPVDLEIAAAAPQIDVIIGGDSHTWLFDPTVVSSGPGVRPDWSVGGVLVCQAGEWGKAVGKLDLSLRLDSNGRYRVMGYSGKLIDVDSSIEPAADVERIVWKHAKPYLRVGGRLREPVPKAEAPGWVAQRLLEASGAQVAAAPSAGIENGLPAGDVTYLDVRKMFPFVNEVVIISVTAKQIVDFAAQADVGLAGARVAAGKLYFGDSAADDDAPYTLAVEDYYAGAYPSLAAAVPKPTGLSTRDIVTEYIRRAAQ